MDYASGLVDSRIFFLSNAQHRIGFSVLEVDVVLGRVLFDEVVLKKKGLVLIVRGDVLNIPGTGYQKPCLNVLFSAKIGGKTVFKALCLAHINDGSTLVAPKIDAALGRSL